MIDICCVGSGVKYHFLSYWSIVMTSQVEFSPVSFKPNRYEKSFKLHNRPGEIKRTFRKPKGIAGAGFEDLRGMACARRKTWVKPS